jgi:hypothetical protein
VQLDEQLKAMGITGYQIENITTVENRSGEIVEIDSDKDPTSRWDRYLDMT